MSDFKTKMHQIRFRPYSAPQTPSWATSKERKGEGGRGKGWKRGGEGDGCPPFQIPKYATEYATLTIMNCSKPTTHSTSLSSSRLSSDAIILTRDTNLSDLRERLWCVIVHGCDVIIPPSSLDATRRWRRATSGRRPRWRHKMASTRAGTDVERDVSAMSCWSVDVMTRVWRHSGESVCVGRWWRHWRSRRNHVD